MTVYGIVDLLNMSMSIQVINNKFSKKILKCINFVENTLVVQYIYIIFTNRNNCLK